MLDANGTRHHLVLGQSDWERLATSLTATSFDRSGQELTLAPLATVPPVWDQPPDTASRRGAAADANANVYAIDPTETAVLAWAAGSLQPTVFWSQTPATQPAATPGAFGPTAAPPAPAPATLRGLAVTTGQYLVAGCMQPNGLLIFDLTAPGPPSRLLWPAALSWAPLHLAATPDGGLLALDGSSSPPRYWRLDRLFNVVSPAGPPASAAPPGSFVPAQAGATPTPVSAALPEPDASEAVTVGANAIAIAQLPSGTVIVLDQAPPGSSSSLEVYVGDRASGVSLSLGEDASSKPIRAAEMSFGPVSTGDAADVAGHAYIVSADREQAYDLIVTESEGVVSTQVSARYLPLRAYAGGVAIAAAGPIYNSNDHWVPLVAQPQTQFAMNATITLGPFDGGDPGCTWHRVMLDAVLPPRCGVSVFSRAADDPDALASLPFQAEPGMVVRPDGSEEPYAVLPPCYSTTETLFQRARGRWLQLQLAVAGDGRTTPRLRAVRIYYPRFSYLQQYLPAVYRADTASASFLDRYLANTEGVSTHIEDLIANAQMLFDPRSAPDGTLDWLADFFDVALDPAWSVPKRRLFIQHAADFFAWRGTVRGLQVAVRLALDPTADQGLFDQPSDPGTLAYRVIELFNTPLLAIPSAPPPASGPSPAALPGPPAAAGTPAPDTALAAAAADQQQWAQFLALRYQRLAVLSAAYGAPYASFSAVPLPASAPAGGAALTDWLDFTTVVAPAVANAHRFVMLIPVPLNPSSDPTSVDPDGLRALAQRIVELNKPVHTVCELRYYWSAFQIGSAQLGNGTAIDVGSRAPQLLVPATLGSGDAGASYLGGAATAYLTPTPSIGRDTTLDS